MSKRFSQFFIIKMLNEYKRKFLDRTRLLWYTSMQDTSPIVYLHTGHVSYSIPSYRTRLL